MPEPRIISLIASATEIVCALGFERQMIGRSHECDFPASVKRLPVCTSPKFEVEGLSYEIDQRVKAILQEALSVYRVDAESEWSYGAVFRRVRKGKSMAELRTDGLAGCLRTPRGGSGRQILFKAGKGKYVARLFTPRECARLMGADDYKISAPANQALFGFGDAVCVPVIEWIAEYYLDPLVNELIRGRARSDRGKLAISLLQRKSP